MGDFAAYLLGNHRDLYKSKTTSKPSQLQLETKRNDRLASRKELRHNELFSKRRIPQNMTPIKSDQDNSKPVTEKPNEQNAKTERWQAFEKWKRERDQRKLQEKIKSKPVFKVSKVPDKIDLEDVNKVIKGKVINASYVSRFAPNNHNFKAPSNVKPLYLTNDKNVPKLSKKNEKKPKNVPAATTRVTRSQVKNATTTQKPTSAKSSPKKVSNKKVEKKEVSKKSQKAVRDNVVLQGGWEVTVNKTPQKSAGKRGGTTRMNKGKENVDLSSKANSTETTKTKKGSVKVDKTPAKDFKTPTRKSTREIRSGKQELQKGGRKLRVLLEKNTVEEHIEKQNKPTDSVHSDNKKTPLKTPKSNKKQTPARNLRASSPSTPPAYVSPFVTVSRGKNSAKKEYACRKSKENFGSPTNANDSPIAGANYFTNLLNSEINRIEGMCDTWQIYKENTELPDGVDDMIDVAIGQSKLLIAKKFQQFRNLVEQYRSNTFTQNKISNMDLHGFWDMMYMQVEDVNKRFEKLETMKSNNWEELMPAKEVKEKKKVGRPLAKKNKSSSSSSLKDLIKAARNKKKQTNDTGADLPVVIMEEKTFDGGYFSIQSPVKNISDEVARKSSTRKSLRNSVLVRQSPGLAMLKVSQAIKLGDGCTPGKSILKTNVSKTPGRSVKTVLFNDTALENDTEEDLIQFSSPIPAPRLST